MQKRPGGAQQGETVAPRGGQQAEPPAVFCPPQVKSSPNRATALSHRFLAKGHRQCCQGYFLSGNGAVQVNDVNLNAWACSVGRWSDGQLHFRNSKYGKCYTGVNTWVWNDQVQKYTRDRSVPTTDGVQIPRMTARFKSIMDFMATRRVAA